MKGERALYFVAGMVGSALVGFEPGVNLGIAVAIVILTELLIADHLERALDRIATTVLEERDQA